MSTSYVKFTDLTTHTTFIGGGTDGWTPVDSSTFDQTLAASLEQGQQANQAPTFSLPLADSGVAVQVEKAMAAGNTLQTEVASYDGSGRLISDILMPLSQVSQDDVAREDNVTVHNLTMEAGAYTSRTTTYDPTTGTPTTTAGGYSFVSKSPITTPAGMAPGDPSTFAASAGTDAHAYSPVDEFVALTDAQGNLLPSEAQIDFGRSGTLQDKLPASNGNLGGSSTYAGHLFETSNLEYEVSTGSGGTTASLSYAAPVDRSSPVLLDMALSGSHLQQVEIIQRGASGNDDTGQVVSDTVLKNVAVTGVTYDLGDDGDSRVYQFQAEAGTDTTSHESTSSAATLQTFSLSASAQGASGVAVADPISDGSKDYNLTIESYADTTTAISSATFAVTGNGVSDHGTFSPLTITFDSMPSADVLAALTGTNKLLTIDQSKATGAGASAPQVFDTLTFRLVVPSGAPVISQDGSYTYTFQVGGFQETYHLPQPDGSTEPLPDEGWNRVFNKSDPASGFEIQPSNACYCTGTLIRTVRGDVAVEDLAIGDLVVTASGVERPVKWIGHRGYVGRFANANPDVLPICFKAGSLADGVPSRDLWVSPKHAMVLEGVLIPAEHLTNGATVVRAERVESIEYWHVELDSHDVLVAEGAEAESFVDDSSRGIFHNAHTFAELYPETSQGEAIYCAPRVEDGYLLEAVRRRLAVRAGLPVPAERAFGALHGHVDGCDATRVWGWARDLAHPDAPVCLDVVVDGAVVGLVYADRFRADLAAASIGDGCHAFWFDLPQPLSRHAGHAIAVRRSADGASLSGRSTVAAAAEAA